MKKVIWTLTAIAAMVASADRQAIAQQPAASAPSQAQVTFTRDVAPILHRSCVVCHRPESIAPMSLINYEDARPWARAIKQRVSAREMPPWYIERNVGIQKFKDDPSLTDQEIATIVGWADSGAQRGNPADMPKPPTFANPNEWAMGAPDLIFTTPKTLTVPASGPDWWVDMEIESGLMEDRYIKAIEFQRQIAERAARRATN